MKAGVVAVLREIKVPLHDICDKLGVNPNAVAGAILGETSMNIAQDGDVHAFLQVIKAYPIANIASQIVRGKSLSLGLGQIKPEPALEVESVLATLEKRPMRSYEEIRTNLQNPYENIKYAAAIVQKCQNDYQQNGYDIKNDTAILATLYNLGDCKNKAIAARKENKKLRPNFIGFFAQHYENEIAKTIQVDKKEQVAFNTQASTPTGADGNTAASATAFARLGKKLVKSAPLSNMPPKCATEGAGNAGLYKKVNTYTPGKTIGSASGVYEVESRGIDCDLKDWSLIRTADGKLGWVADSQLQKNSVETTVPASKSCQSSDAKNCLSQMKAQGIKFTDLGGNDKGETEIQLIGDPKNPKDINFRKFEPECLIADYGQKHQSVIKAEEPSLSAADAKEYLSKIEKKKSDIVLARKYQNWDDPENVFTKQFSEIEKKLRECESGCMINNKGYLDYFLQNNISQYNGLSGYKQFISDTNQIEIRKAGYDSFEGNYSDEKQEAKYQGWMDYLEKIETTCGSLISKFPEAKTQLTEIRDRLGEMKKVKKQIRPLNLNGNLAGVKTLEICSILDKVSKNISAGEKIDPKAALEGSSCIECTLYMMVKASTNGRSNLQFQLKTLLATVTSDSDVKDLLIAAIEPLRNGAELYDMAYGDSSYCKYDPLASVKLVKDLLKNKCVENVFVPDPFIIKSLKGQESKVIYKTFQTDDRFSVRLTGGCPK